MPRGLAVSNDFHRLEWQRRGSANIQATTQRNVPFRHQVRSLHAIFNEFARERNMQL